MPEYKFELERSDYYNKRSSLLKSHGFPKLSDTKANLGDILAKVVFEQCDDALKEDFGLKEPLKGPGDVLWVSPSDLLIGKIALKPPFTPKCLQALTHHGILEIGQSLENRFRNEMEQDKQKALDKYKTELLASVEDRMKSEIKDVEIRERLACHIEMEKAQQQFEITLKEELDNLEAKIREQYEQIIANHDSNLKARWEKKMQKEISKTVDTMTQQYLVQLDEQEEKLTGRLKLELKKQELLREFECQLYNRRRVEALRQLKHKLECTNLVNMMYILCTERQHCCDQKEKIEKRYKEEIKALEGKILHKEEELKKITAENKRQIKEVALRETCLTEIIKHFQKFINFALKAAPAQAEFLLSVEKMMVFELASKIAESGIEPSTQEAAGIIPWLYEENSVPTSSGSHLTIPDHHNCFRELNPPVKENVELDENDILPAIYFKNKTYVREDFRDMLSGGVKLTPSNELWNKDVEILVDYWRREFGSWEDKKDDSFEKESIMNKIEDPRDSITLRKSSVDKIDMTFFQDRDRRRSSKSAVQFISGGTEDQPSQKSPRVSLESRKSGQKSSLKPGTFPCLDEINLYMPTKETSQLLAAKDSLEILVEKRKSELPNEQADSEDIDFETRSLEADVPNAANTAAQKEKELVVETKDSVILRMSSMAKTPSSGEFMVEPKDSVEMVKLAIEDKEDPVNPRLSRISCAKNSVEMLRESLMKLHMPASICQKRDSKRKVSKSVKSASSATAGTPCCERCKRKEDLTSESTQHSKNWFLSDSNGDERSVKISRIEIINLDDVPTPSVVSFNPDPVYLKKSPRTDKFVPIAAKSTMTPSSKSSKRKPSRKTGKPVKPHKCKLLGEMEAKEGFQNPEEFTADRIHSLVKLMSDQPHLMQLFTAGIR